MTLFIQEIHTALLKAIVLALVAHQPGKSHTQDEALSLTSISNDNEWNMLGSEVNVKMGMSRPSKARTPGFEKCS